MSNRRSGRGRSATGAKGRPAAGAPARPRSTREKIRDVFVARPFQGLASEPDWIALRELVPAATAPLRLAPGLIEQYGDRDVAVATVLPMAWPVMTKPDGRILLGLQRNSQSGDLSRDLARAVLAALETAPGRPVSVPALPGPGPRLQDLLAGGHLDVTVREGFDFWLDESSADAEVLASLERANASVFPTMKLAAAPAAYWCQFPERAHVRWVLAEDEDAALAALSRLAAQDGLRLGDRTRFAGMFRAHGLLIPVWDVPQAAPAGDWEGPLAGFAKRYAEASAQTGELDAAAKRARHGLLGRQLQLR